MTSRLSSNPILVCKEIKSLLLIYPKTTEPSDKDKYKAQYCSRFPMLLPVIK